MSPRPTECRISFENVSLVYDLHYDKTSTLKEHLVNFFHRRRYVPQSIEKLYALKELTFEVRQGEKLGVIGFNGAGKTTLLRVIARLLRPTTGKCEIVGNVQPLIEVGAGFNPEFSGRENIYLNGCMLGFNRKEIRAKENDIIEFSELGHFIDVPAKYYSTGMAMRLAFTIATIIRPEILVMDEMLSAGDLSFIEKAKTRMNEVVTNAKLVVLVSHDLGLIESFCNRVIVLDGGRKVYDGDAQSGLAYYREHAKQHASAA